MREMGLAWVVSREMEGEGRRWAGDALLMERARCCDPARAGAARAQVLLPRLAPALICGSAGALVRQVDLAHHNTSL